MKRATLALLLLFCITTFAQQGINYKALIKDGSGSILANRSIQVDFIILDGVQKVYEETHLPTTDANGILILNIGEGTPSTGTFSAIDWSSTNHFLNVKIDTGDGLQDMGATAFKTMPYALTAKTAINVVNDAVDDADADPTNEIELPTGGIHGQVLTLCEGLPVWTNEGDCPVTCTDGIKNGDETGIDCGGSCPVVCPPTCYDGIKNGDETGIDCGGSCPQECASPVDIIFVVDNSASMNAEIQALQANIYNNFAAILENSGLDYRIILISEFGDIMSESVCIEAPLSGIPGGGCTDPPPMPVNSSKFFHYSVPVGSRTSLCTLLDTWDVTDEYGLAPNGWKDWLRPNSIKTIIELSDDGVNCTQDAYTYNDGNTGAGGTTVASAFNAALTTLSPTHFGTTANPNYKFHSIIGIAGRPGGNPYLFTDAMITVDCPTSASYGTGYQGLSIDTEGFRFSSCDTDYYDVIFQLIVQNVIRTATP